MRPRRAVALIIALSAAFGCHSGPTEAERAEQRDLATLRTSTARFDRYSVAGAAGYTFLFQNGCMADPSGAGRGAMGNHYVNTALLDDSVEVSKPEALLYEPGLDGTLTFVAAEYVIPKSAWTRAVPPKLFGRDFTLNAYDLWALHVWAWKDNPSGLFADWNPSVSCQYATTTTVGTHH